MDSIPAKVRERMEQAASQIIPSVSSRWVSDLADRLLDGFPELKSANATSLKEVAATVAPWFKAAGIATVTALVIAQIGTAGLALSSAVLLSLAVFAIGLYLIYKAGPCAIRERLDDMLAPIHDAFGGVIMGSITYDDFCDGFKTASLHGLNRSALA